MAQLLDRKCETVKKAICFIVCHCMLFFFINKATAQTVQYSRENVFVNQPDDLQLVANIAGNHHMLCFNKDEEPEIFVFSAELKFKQKTSIPYKLSEKADIRITPFKEFYYLFVLPRTGQENVVFKIAGNGSVTNVSASFQKLLRTINIKLPFQLVANQEKLWLLYHTSLTDEPKNSVVIVQTDSLLNFELSYKVVYDFKKGEETLQQVTLLSGEHLLILKTLQEGTLLQLSKINLATGNTFTKEFKSEGHSFLQSNFTCNDADSTVTVSSLLSGNGSNFKSNIFLSRLNSTLNEQVPLAILKPKLKSDASTSFLYIEGLPRWLRFKEQSFVPYVDVIVSASLFADPVNLTLPTPTYQVTNKYYKNEDDRIRFSLLNKNLEIENDSVVANNKKSSTLFSNEFTSFILGNKTYLLLDQLLFNRHRGLLMINEDDSHKLAYTDVRVSGKNVYLLPKARVVSNQYVIIPYTNKKEAGLIKITVE